MTADLVGHDRDVRAADVGMWLFVASLVMFFGALFSGYVLLRAGHSEWPASWLTGGGLADPWFRLLWLVVAAASARAAAAPVRASSPAFLGRHPLPIAALAGAMFCARTWAAGRALVDAGHGPATHVAAASWFALNGVLAVLVAGAVFATAWIALTTPGDRVRTRLLARYWMVMLAFGITLLVGMYLV